MTRCALFLQDYYHRQCSLDEGHDGPHVARIDPDEEADDAR